MTAPVPAAIADDWLDKFFVLLHAKRQAISAPKVKNFIIVILNFSTKGTGCFVIEMSEVRMGGGEQASDLNPK
ncbi:MAG TPA: hypothetical protein PKA00_19895 [Saprospiraceae bacterium]|nr:hypothetical protein [Saprospiraceae bacterium]